MTNILRYYKKGAYHRFRWIEFGIIIVELRMG